MSCCTAPLIFPALFAGITVTETDCADYCFHNPTICVGYSFSNNLCSVCEKEFKTSTCGSNDKPLVSRPVCHGNTCVATYHDMVEIYHGTVVYLSYKQEKYEPIPFNQDGSVYLNLSIPEPNDVTIIGPGAVSADLPLIFGKGLTVTGGVEFRQCSNPSRAKTAIRIQQSGKLLIDGFVKYHHAEVFVTVAPESPLGNSVLLEDTSAITFSNTGTSLADSKVCAAAFSSVEGEITVNCSNDCFTVSQDLGGTNRLILTENNVGVTNVNITSLLNDFGSEYIVEFVDGPADGDSTPTAIASILGFLTLTTLILTVVVQQRYFNFSTT